MISIRPDEAEKPSFAEVLGKVKSQCNLGDLGIESGVKFRTTMSGGRLLQLPNSVGEEKVEQLAQKLLPEEMKVTRPVITADFLVRGLDESDSKKEVRVAIATKSGCHPDNIKVGEIRTGCLEQGHTRAFCTASTDRSALCYRCGQPGHVASACFERSHCVVCADVNRPANHVMGGNKCKPPRQKGNAPPTTQANSQAVAAQGERQSELNG
ncbi:hypothetical protein ACJJTC_005600 [Scirpophaga incertulas]